ncbi:MAG: HAD family hydrolase [candidate division WOR-3 bacterium]|jgi:HAD superfamily hydrolase (TIGR01509 family)
MLRAGHDVRAVLFDLDGVLIDSYYAWFHQFQQALLHFGFAPVTEEEFRKQWGHSTDHDVKMFMPGRTSNEVRQYFSDHYHEYVHYLRLEPGAERILRFVDELELRIGCVTNSHRPIVRETLAHFRLADYFETVVTADDVPQPKPAPAMIHQACEHLGARPGQTVFLGDTLTDAAAAGNAGCFFVGYRIDGAARVEDHGQFAALLTCLLRGRKEG